MLRVALMNRGLRAATVIATLVLVAALARSAQQRAAPSPSGSPAAASDPPLGSERQYHLELATKAEVRSGATLVDLKMAGRLSLTPIVGGPLTIVRAQYTSESLSLAGQATTGDGDAPSAAVRRAIEEPFYLVVRDDGERRELVALRGSSRVIPFVAQIWRSVGAALQHSGTADRADTEWDATERDTVGRYVAHYQVVGDRTAPTRVLARTKQHYLAPEERAAVPIEIVGSHAEIELDASRRLRALRSDETLRAMNAPLPEIDASTQLDLVLRAEADRRSQLDAWTAQLESAPVIEPEAVQRDSKANDRATLGAWRYEGILATLRDTALANAAGKATKEERSRSHRAYSALCALLRLHPSMLEDVRAHILEDGPLTSALIAALRDAGTEQAQAVLRSLLTAPTLDVVQRMRVARGLSHVEAPTAESVQALRELQGDPVVGLQATYGLGSELYRLRQRDPALAGTILSDLLTQLAEADSSRRVVEVLTALGSGGHPSTYEAVAPYLNAPTEEIRRAAVQALRRVGDPRVDQVLAEACRDPSASVRYSAIDASSERAPSSALIGALALLLPQEPVFEVRARAVRLAARWLDNARDLLGPSLALIAEGDQSADLRHVARTALSAAR